MTVRFYTRPPPGKKIRRKKAYGITEKVKESSSLKDKPAKLDLGGGETFSVLVQKGTVTPTGCYRRYGSQIKVTF